jgi:hypothetical protein
LHRLDCKIPDDPDHDSDNPANAGSRPQEQADEYGEAVDHNRNGEPINNLFD